MLFTVRTARLIGELHHKNRKAFPLKYKIALFYLNYQQQGARMEMI